MSKVHFIACMYDHGDESCCSQFEPDFMTGRWEDVTCGTCKRSRRWRAASKGEPMLLTGYRKPYVEDE